jgi:hypothetical protein
LESQRKKMGGRREVRREIEERERERKKELD